MQSLNLRKRLTHKYVDSYRHLDRHVTIGGVTLTPRVQVEPATDFDEGGRYVQYARLPAGLSPKQRKEWREVLAENLSKWGCSHEYDCCGCMLVHARAYPTKDARRVLVRVAVSYNY